LILFPADDIIYCIDTRKYVSSGEVVITTWSGTTLTCFAEKEDGTILTGSLKQSDNKAWAGLLTGYLDYDQDYICHFGSGWFDLNSITGDSSVSNREIILKRYETTMIADSLIYPTMEWAFDYSESPNSVAKTIGGGAVYEYGIAEYGQDSGAGPYLSEYGPGIAITKVKVNTKGSGKVLSIGFKTTISSGHMSCQRSTVQFKIGRNT
jgi:hypothetical protein